jgi:4-amino-4-deoxy-L-arabinose transferase-like glycosyltransferase
LGAFVVGAFVVSWRAFSLQGWLARRSALATFARLGPSLPGWAWIALIGFILVVPAISLRSFHYEEGTVVALARGAIEEGHWLSPHQHGFRFVERPVLMSWLVAALATPFGGVNQWIARIPAVLSLLFCGGLVFCVLRKYVSALAALFGVICFFFSPAILQKAVTAEADGMVTALLFAAFCLWWFGYAGGRLSLRRWLAIGLVLGAAGLTKGPQPLAFFGLGVGAFLLVQRRWSELPGFVFANLCAGVIVLSWYAAVYQPGDVAWWIQHGRMRPSAGAVKWAAGTLRFAFQFTLEALPGLLLSVPFVVGLFRSGRLRSEELVLALLLYAGCCTVLLLFWPGGVATRYAMPATPAMAVLAGLAFERLRDARPQLVNAAVLVAAGLAAYQLIVNWLVMPLAPEAFQSSRLAARTVTSAMAVKPAPLFVTFASFGNNNMAAYLPPPIRIIRLAEANNLPTPAWALLSPSEIERLRAMRPDLTVSLRAVLPQEPSSHLVLIEKQ